MILLILKKQNEVPLTSFYQLTLVWLKFIKLFFVIF